MKRKTKIIATLGPSSLKPEILEKFEKLNVNCIRINTAHGDFEQYKEMIETVRKYTSIPILIDIKGPELRIRTNEMKIDKGDEIWFGFEETKDHYFSYNFYDEVDEGNNIYFDNGSIEAEIKKKENNEILIKFNENALLKPNKGVNIPNKPLNIPSLSQKDKESVEFAKNEKLAYIALSFVRNKKDVEGLRRKIKGSGIGIISKIENWEGIENIDEIIESSEGIMVARGDLGVEIPEEKIPILQKEILTKCNKSAKIGVVATQMLESMTDNKVPTRAEVSDVANAILDGADAVMLSGETAAGKNPIKSVKIMNKVAQEMEEKIENHVDMNKHGSISEELSKSAYFILHRTNCSKLVTITRSGYSAKLVARYRLARQVIAVTDDEMTKDKLELVWGVLPVYVKQLPKGAGITKTASELVKKKLIHKKEEIVFFAAIKTLQEQVSNLIEVHHVDDLLNFNKKIKNNKNHKK